MRIFQSTSYLFMKKFSCCHQDHFPLNRYWISLNRNVIHALTHRARSPEGNYSLPLGFIQFHVKELDYHFSLSYAKRHNGKEWPFSLCHPNPSHPVHISSPPLLLSLSTQKREKARKVFNNLIRKKNNLCDE